MIKFSGIEGYYDKLNIGIQQRAGSYSKLKSQYMKMAKKISKTDFANADVVLKQELEVLENLKIKAFSENKMEESDWIDKRISEIQDIISKQNSEPDFDILTLIANYNALHVNDADELTPEEAENLKNEKLAQEFVEVMPQLKEFDAFRLARNFNEGGFEDKLLFEDCMKKLLANFSVDSSIRILSMLSADSVDGNKVISKDEVNGICSLRKCLQYSRNNEAKERKHPLSQNNVDMIEELCRKLFEQDKTLAEKQEEYEKYVNEAEEALIIDFIKKFKNENGGINNKYIRAAIALREAGIVYSSLLNLLEYITDRDGNIDNNKLSAVCELKKKGIISTYIKPLNDACQKDENGKTSEADMKICSDLSSYCFYIDEILELLPAIKKNPELEELVINLAYYIPQQGQTSGIVNIMKSDDGKINEDSYEIMYDILSAYPDEVTIDFVKTLFDLSKGTKNEAGESASAICAAMTHNGEPSENLIKALKLCSDKDGNLDENLSDILWSLKYHKADYSQIEKLISSCKNQDNIINREKTNYILSMIKQKTPVEKIFNIFC